MFHLTCIVSFIIFLISLKSKSKYHFISLKEINQIDRDDTHNILTWMRETVGDPYLEILVLDTDSTSVVFTDYGIVIQGKAIIPYNTIQSITDPVASDKKQKAFREVTVTLKDGRKISFRYVTLKHLTFYAMIQNIRQTGIPRPGVEYVQNEALIV